MSAKPEKRLLSDSARAQLGLRPQTGPAAPPETATAPPSATAAPWHATTAPWSAPAASSDAATAPSGAAASWWNPGAASPSAPVAPAQRYLVEPTDRLPIVAAPSGAPTPGPVATPGPAGPLGPATPGLATPGPATAARRNPPPPTVAARAVIVYETPLRRPWRLWVFTAVIVALTVGVVLGQAVAWQPVSRTASASAITPAPEAAPSTVPVQPGPGQQVSAPLGTIRSRVLVVTGAASILRIRSAALGDSLLHAAALDSSATPIWADTPEGTRLDLVGTGAPGTAGLDLQLNAKVSWTIKLTAGATEQDVDMRSGGLAALQLTSAESVVVLRLPKPKGTVKMSVTGPVSRLSVSASTATPVRLRLAQGAGVVTVDEARQRTVKPGTPLTPTGWKTAKNRYDLTTSAAVGSLAVTHR